SIVAAPNLYFWAIPDVFTVDVGTNEAATSDFFNASSAFPPYSFHFNKKLEIFYVSYRHDNILYIDRQ
ncbi:hypothetical protein L9F63_013220, partial [Diploptera punctata]